MVVFIFNSNGEVLLFEKIVKYCAGHLVGPGGKVEPGETLHDASVRETLDECGLTVVLGEALGAVTCHNEADMSDVRVHMYRTETYSGELRNAEQTKHRRMGWYPVNPETIAQMMAGDRGWFGHVVRNEPFEAEVWYNQEWRVVRATVRPLS